jgi:UDPglucose 6-dehydrogenase
MVAKAMGLDQRIGPRFLKAGAGFGGSCFPKDTRALVRTAENVGYDMRIVKSVIAVNDEQRYRMVDKVEKAAGGLEGKTIALLGLTFKPDTDDLREAPALDMARVLLEKGAKIRAYDPVAMELAAEVLDGVVYCPDVYDAVTDADMAVFATEWNEFRDLDLVRLQKLMRSPLIVDCRNIYEPLRMKEHGFTYHSVGRSPQEA